MTHEKAEEIQAILSMCSTNSKIVELYENNTMDFAVLGYEEADEFDEEYSENLEMITDSGTKQLYDISDEIDKYTVTTGKGKERKTYIIFEERYMINLKDLSIKKIKQMNIKLSPEQMRWIRELCDSMNNNMRPIKVIHNQFRDSLLYNNNLYNISGYYKYDEGCKLNEIIMFNTLDEGRVAYIKYNNKEYKVHIEYSEKNILDIDAMVRKIKRQNLWIFENENVIIISNKLVYDKRKNQVYFIRDSVIEFLDDTTTEIYNKNVIEGNWIFLMSGKTHDEISAVYNIRTHTLYDVEAVYSEGKISLVSINENSLQKRINIQTKIGTERLLIKANTDIEKYNLNIEEINSIDELLESEDM